METSIEIAGDGRASEVRRAVVQLAAQLGLDEAGAGRAALAGTELATNLAKYGRQGWIAVSDFDDMDGRGIQLLAVDRGPGIAQFDAALRDGFSTGGSLGLGLGVLQRNADVFDHYSAAGQGAALLVRIARPRSRPDRVPGRLQLGVRAAPKPGQEQSGDAWAFRQAGRWQRLGIVDGLGHGPLAADAALKAVQVVHASTERDTPATVLAAAHAALRSTRGAVMSVVDIDTAAGQAVFSGIGNATGLIVGQAHGLLQTQHLMALEGIVGYNMRRTREHRYAWLPGSVLVLASDGLSSRIQIDPALLDRHPALIAGVLFRGHLRGTDDATVVVAKLHP
ncbi:SpoIIE family protein phosphatase [Xylophilus sp.]|uniref:SpoIIE family protein phosphatase n=1 Tax=Xylophilus sp. TaxID=2653893 RepID=UPI0013B880EB|nr:SpoIIE family protein phosphatase [Xylophilus sp.]KAF1048767.1 MAG: Serine/threonine-protein kinase RsbT [Xylophilus sp.]